jgi:CrcB protein
MNSAVLWIAIAAAGALGAIARFTIDGHVHARTNQLGWGTTFINLSGALALGLMAGLAPAHAIVLIVGIGFFGAYTTFSTWILEAVLSADAGRIRTAATLAIGQLVIGLGCAALGYLAGVHL